MGEVATFDTRYRNRLGRMLLAALLMGVVLVVLSTALMPLLGTPGWRYLALTLLVSTGGIAYGLFGQAIGAFQLSEFSRALRGR
jgi:putative peptidoglycan lipid II flippase